jgi:hypothetical protein
MNEFILSTEKTVGGGPIASEPGIAIASLLSRTPVVSVATMGPLFYLLPSFPLNLQLAENVCANVRDSGTRSARYQWERVVVP